MLQHGFVRVAAALPRLRVADCAFNAERLVHLLDQAEQHAVQILVFPELALTGYTCGDLFHQPALQRAALDALDQLLDESKTRYSGVFAVGPGSQRPARSPSPHQVLLRWKSSSGEEPTGEETAHDASATKSSR